MKELQDQLEAETYFSVKIDNKCFETYFTVFSRDDTAAILATQNNETAAMLVYQTNPVGDELFPYVNTFFCSNKFIWPLAT